VEKPAVKKAKPERPGLNEWYFPAKPYPKIFTAYGIFASWNLKSMTELVYDSYIQL